MHKKTPSACWVTKGDGLVLALPSSSKIGEQYLVGIKPIGDKLIVQHSCPAKTKCWHIQAAVEYWQRHYFWLEAPKKIERINKSVILNKNWKQVPVPVQDPISLMGVS